MPTTICFPNTSAAVVAQVSEFYYILFFNLLPMFPAVVVLNLHFIIVEIKLKVFKAL